tara:strand:- start:937 stop:1425 length:489 start_codon:yes stop_codon:yes gene_type:complete
MQGYYENFLPAALKDSIKAGLIPADSGENLSKAYVEIELIKAAQEPWACNDRTLGVTWKEDAGSNSGDLIPVMTWKGIPLTHEELAWTIFGSGMRCRKISRAWSAAQDSLPPRWQNISWETAISLAAAREYSHWERKDLGSRLQTMWAWILVDPQGALGLKG